GRIAAHVEHAVDRTGAAEGFAARPLQHAPGGARLTLAQVIPVDLGVVEDPQHPGRDVDPDVAVGGPGFEQHDARAALGEAGGGGAPTPAPSSERRAATTHPAEPAPITT